MRVYNYCNNIVTIFVTSSILKSNMIMRSINLFVKRRIQMVYSLRVSITVRFIIMHHYIGIIKL